MKPFPLELVEQLTPFLIVWDKETFKNHVSQCLAKLWNLGDTSELATEDLQIVRPKMGELRLDWLSELTDLTIHLARRDAPENVIRGQFIEDEERWLFVGSPYIFSIDDLHRSGLQIGDLPLHDSTGDLLIAAETTQAAYQQTRDKANELTALNDELAAANRMMSGLIPAEVRTTLGWDSSQEGELAERMLLVGHVIENLQAALDFRERFLATMSHELRTPLNAILGLSEAILEGVYGDLTEGQTRGLETVFSSGQHLLSLINDVLEMSKIESGEATINPRETTAPRLCQTIIKMLHGLAREKDLELVFEDITDGQPFECDIRRIRQVLVNLVGNAVKFTEEGTITLSVALDSATERVEFSVTDTGIGIRPQVLEEIFSPFYQVDQKLNRNYEGTGLGLAISKHTVEMHHGEISVSSTPGEGSRFNFWLPRQSPLLDEVEAALADFQKQQEETGQ